MSISIPENESGRLERLRSYDILDTAPEDVYDDLCFLAAWVCQTPMAAITLIDDERQWFKAKQGIEADETPREDAFCAHAIADPTEVLVVEDARLDERFADNPQVRGDPHIRFYAGAPLWTSDGHGLGTICAIDDEPRELDPDRKRALEALSRQVMTQLELRRRSVELREVKEEFEAVNDELRRSNEELDRFASVVSHELKDPISQVVSNLDLLSYDVADELPDEQAEMLEEAQTGAERMSSLVGDLLRYARAGKADTEHERVDAGEVVDASLDELADRVEATDARIEVGELPAIEADPTLVRQVFKNLVDNAIKYRDDEPPTIQISAEVQGDEARFEVADEGIGIPEEDRQRLFKVFERASNTGDREGTGVGLALSARIVERHGGSIGVDSEEGVGSTFWFTLPLPADG